MRRGYLLFWGEFQRYFIECVENISNFTNVCFFLLLPLKAKTLTFFPSHFSIILLGSARLVDIILDVNIVCTYKIFIMSFYLMDKKKFEV